MTPTFSNEPLSVAEWAWVRFYCHPCQIDELLMLPAESQVQAVRGLIFRAKSSYARVVLEKKANGNA